MLKVYGTAHIHVYLKQGISYKQNKTHLDKKKPINHLCNGEPEEAGHIFVLKTREWIFFFIPKLLLFSAFSDW